MNVADPIVEISHPVAVVPDASRVEVSLARAEEMLRQTREMIDQVATPQEAVLLVRRTSAAEKVVLEALKSYRARERDQFELKQAVAEVQVRTQRRAGELLMEVKKHRGGRPATTDSSRAEVSPKPMTLRELGVSAQESHRWQRIARIPTDAFEEWVVSTQEAGQELATSRALALAARYAKRVVGGGEAASEAPRRAGRDQYEQVRSFISRMLRMDPAALVADMAPARRSSELERVRELREWLGRLEDGLRRDLGHPGHVARTASTNGDSDRSMASDRAGRRRAESQWMRQPLPD